MTKCFWQVFTAGLFVAGFGAAQTPVLSLPIDCTLGKTCFIQQYVDHDAGKDAVDFACGVASYDGHKGTDIRLPSGFAMARGVAVLAAADGVVLSLRDNMLDKRVQTKADREAIKGRECGNGVRLDHGNGWVTQYCHMKRGSILVEKGARVARGEPLGMVGLSGNTQFPHVHLSVNKGGQVIDPFQPKKVNKCGTMSGENLWDTAFSAAYTYQPTQIVLVGFAPRAVKYSPALDGEYVDLTPLTASKPLVAYGLAVNLRKGDILRVILSGPMGVIADSKSKDFPKSKAQWMSFTGKKAPKGGWPKGAYQSRMSVLRAGQILTTHSLNYQMK